jgi:hypothetical protein
MSWTYEIVDTRTGVRQSVVFPSSGSWNRVLNAQGSGSHSFPNAIPIASRAAYRTLFRPWARTLVVSRNGVARYAGIITGYSFDWDSGMWQIQHADIRALLARRYTMGTNGYSGDTADNKLELINYTLASIVPWVVWAGTAGPTANYDLPILLADGGAVGTESRTYYDYNFTTLDSALDEITNLGPDVDFAPRWNTSGALYYQQIVGMPLIAAGTWEWNLTAAEPGLFGVRVTVNATKQATVVFATGTGSEVDMQVKTARTDSDLPALERQSPYKGADHGLPALQAHANADLALYSKPTEQWSLSMLAGEGPRIENVDLGFTARIWSKDLGGIPDGWTSLRLIGYSNDMSEKITFDVQPIGA